MKSTHPICFKISNFICVFLCFFWTVVQYLSRIKLKNSWKNRTCRQMTHATYHEVILVQHSRPEWRCSTSSSSSAGIACLWRGCCSSISVVVEAGRGCSSTAAVAQKQGALALKERDRERKKDKKWSSLGARTHVRIKGQNLNFYLETHAATPP